MLPYMEEAIVHDIGKGKSYTSGKLAALGTQVTSPVKGFACPSRRSEYTLFPCPQCQTDAGNYRNFTYPPPGMPITNANVARTDYCANAGDHQPLPNGVEVDREPTETTNPRSTIG